MLEFNTNNGFEIIGLRDYFAAKALPGLIGRGWEAEGKLLIDTWAFNAYIMADAILEARKQSATDNDVGSKGE